MIQTDSAWHDKLEVQKGDYGENIVQNYFISKGYQVYKQVSGGSHPFDFAFFKDNEFLYVEVKTKPRRRKYADTGLNFRNYKIYKSICEKENKRIYIVFVDPFLKKMYGNYLNELDKGRLCWSNSTELNYYPLDEERRGVEIRYWPLEAMEDISELTDEQIARFQEFYGKEKLENYA